MSKTVKVHSDEVTILSAEDVKALPVDVQEKVTFEISTVVEKANVTETILAKIKEDYSELKIADINDKSGYLAVKAARKNVKNIRVAASKLFKKGREEAQLVVKQWISKENEIAGQLSEIEDRLEKDEDWYEAEQKKLKQAREEQIKKQETERMEELMQFGAKMIDGNWVLEGVIYEMALVREVDEEVYINMRDEFKAQFDATEKIRLDKEAKEEADRKELKRQQDELLELQRQAKQDRTNNRVELLTTMGMSKIGDSYVFAGNRVWVSEIEGADAENWGKIIENVKQGISQSKKEADEAVRIKNLFSDRFPRLKEWSSNGHFIYFEGQSRGDVSYIVSMTDEEFDEFVNKNDIHLLKKAEQAEENRKQDIENARLEGIGGARSRDLAAINHNYPGTLKQLGGLSEDEYTTLYANQKKLYDDAKKIADDKAEAERQELLTEKEKYSEYIHALKFIPVPEVKSGQYRAKINPIKAYIDALK